MLIYHIVLPEVWESFKDENFYEAASLKAEGFIHCSYSYQLETVLERYYKTAEKVLILSVNPNLLAAELISEPSTGGEIYPHIYGKINRAAIADVTEKYLR
ncbi:MAG: DUF952 domain-containing protein [Pyrinomonadaceae bacterium]